MPRPVAGIMETKLLVLCIITSSLLMVVAPLIEGEPVESARFEVCPMRFDWRRPSILVKRSRMSLSPASSLIPGSRYIHSAPSSVQSLHLGFVPSHLDFRDRHISHCGRLVSTGGRIFAGLTYSNCSSPSWIIDACIGAPSLQRIDSVIACIVIIAVPIPIPISISICLMSTAMQAVHNLFPISRGLGQVPGLLGRSQNAFSRETGHSACTG